jgi:DNA modification methylase
MPKEFYKGKEEKIKIEPREKEEYIRDEIGGWIKIPKKEEKEPIKDLDNLKPIDHGVITYPHTPVYKMHRYFARRPWSVFNELIKHYSNPGSIVLDPFCGGGVTVVEGLRLRRKVIGVDLNPMATFITRMEVIDVDLNELKKAFSEIEKAVKDEIQELYLTICPKCKKETPAWWFEWSYIYECPNCKKEVQLSKAKKLSGGKYQCYHCHEIFKVVDAKRIGEIPIRLKVNCECGFKGEKKPEDHDFKKVEWIEKNFERVVKEKKLWFPKDKIYEGYNTNQLLKRGFYCFYEIFTKRNLLALSQLLKEINKINNKKIRELYQLVFSSRLFENSKLAHIKGKTVVKPGHHFWPADIPSEANVWIQFNNASKILKSGKIYSKKEIGSYYKEANSFEDLQNGSATCWILTKSSTNLREIPDESIDVVITDPPYGGNVNYSEMTDFWAIWIRKTLGLRKNEFIDREEEIIINPYQTYLGRKKKLAEYRELMYRVFKECYRVLKPKRWLVMTFHNRDFQVWNAIHLAAHDAGFILSEEDGMIYQPPIQAYTTTLHQKRGGAMLGDFILSFRKAEVPPKKKLIEYVDIGRRIQELAAETIQYHGGATLSQIYMRLIPFLLNKGKLEEIRESDLPKYLGEKFEEKDGKWYFKEKLDSDIEEYLRNYNKEHYKEEKALLDFVPVEARLETIIRWVLIKKGSQGAKMDEILNEIYSRLINSNAPEYGEISRVLNRIAVQRPDNKRYWILKETLRQQMLFEKVLPEREKLTEKEEITREVSEHDLMILRLLEIGESKGYGCHVGLKEQSTMLEFKKRSEPMLTPSQYGMDKSAFDIVREIDMLWLKGDKIVAAFEVEKSTTIDSGINRFRNLFVVQPRSKIAAYIVVPDKRKMEAIKKLNSPANRKEKLHEKIKIIKFSDLKIGKPVEEVEVIEV